MGVHTHFERHRAGRAGWLRAAVLGADDGILSTASLMIGVAGSGAARDAVLTAGLAGLTAGSLAMAIGEYVSVSSQSDTEAADAAREGRELVENAEAEQLELARIYRDRGLPADLADQVATALMTSDPLGAHLRDELGQTEHSLGHPTQAALASAVSFALGAVVALVAGVFAPDNARVVTVGVAAAAALVALGVAGAAAGGASLRRGGLRVAAGGVLAMLITFGIGHLFGTATGT
jgi:VIT1/CCC1 family predicted Fe2+/Mn2+ transporter